MLTVDDQRMAFLGVAEAAFSDYSITVPPPSVIRHSNSGLNYWLKLIADKYY